MRLLNNQKGYALLLMLSGLSAVTLGFTVVSSMISQSQWALLTHDAFQLNDERSRLIYYAVDYANLYDSGGAGPGHLPCPDTDEGMQRAGPNPPCGGDRLANGKIPDGVTRTAGRIALTESLLNRSTYTVSRALVNNPSLPINSIQWPDENPFETLVNGYVRLSRPSGQARTLTKQHIEQPTLQWVRAWLSWQLLETSLEYCDKESGLIDGDVNLRFIGVCSKITHSNTSNISLGNSCTEENTLCTFTGYDALHWLTNRESEQWQNTRMSNHWFVKNRWLDLLEIQAQSSCLDRTADCVLYLDEIEQNLSFRLLPDETDEDDD